MVTQGTTQETELKALGSCSRCGIALSKSRAIHFVPLNKKARWAYPVLENRELLLPWKNAVGVLCDTCHSAKLTPYFAVELRPGTFLQYTMVELQDSFVPTKELLDFAKSHPYPFRWVKAPEQLKQAIRSFLNGEEISEADLSLVQWYVWQWGAKRDVPPNFSERVAFSDLVGFRKYVENELKSRRGLDPFEE